MATTYVKLGPIGPDEDWIKNNQNACLLFKSDGDRHSYGLPLGTNVERAKEHKAMQETILEMYERLTNNGHYILNNNLDWLIKRRYFLLENHPTKSFDDLGMDGLKKAIEDGSIGYYLLVTDYLSDPASILSAYDGWKGFAILTQEQYLQIKNLEK